MLGKKIEELRRARRLTQEDLGRALGVSKSAVSMYEAEKRHPDKALLLRMAAFFSVTTDYLLDAPESGGGAGGEYPRAVGLARKHGVTEQELLFAIQFLISSKEILSKEKAEAEATEHA